MEGVEGEGMEGGEGWGGDRGRGGEGEGREGEGMEGGEGRDGGRGRGVNVTQSNMTDTWRGEGWGGPYLVTVPF